MPHLRLYLRVFAAVLAAMQAGVNAVMSVPPVMPLFDGTQLSWPVLWGGGGRVSLFPEQRVCSDVWTVAFLSAACTCAMGVT